MNDFQANKIKAVIFDLGGVLYKIDHGLTREAFARLGGGVEFSLTNQSQLFDDYDRGFANAKEFIVKLRNECNLTGSDSDIINAWNKMLIGLIDDNVEAAVRLSQNTPIYLLSNINDLHYEAIKSECASLFAAFENLFFSYQMGMRKPEDRIYSHVLNLTGLSPSETLFIDDAPQNAAAARELGIAAHHLKNSEDLPRLVERLIQRKLIN